MVMEQISPQLLRKISEQENGFNEIAKKEIYNQLVSDAKRGFFQSQIEPRSYNQAQCLVGWLKECGFDVIYKELPGFVKITVKW